MHDDEEWFTLPDDYTVQIATNSYGGSRRSMSTLEPNPPP